ncbi:MAG: response regulator transcription factor [Oscillospiraceae bacterium]|nr:response regulator transcription factor [Oscillospiraceae bacterium]
MRTSRSPKHSLRTPHPDKKADLDRILKLHRRNVVLHDIHGHGDAFRMMPEMNGLDVLRQLRSRGINTPAMFLSARTEVYQRVEGLDAGADDYLAKPFSTTELLARVRAMLRRKDAFSPDLLQCGDLQLNRSTFELSCGDAVQSLSAKEFQIAELLMERAGTIIPTEQLISHIWGWDTDVDTGAVWAQISNLRKKLNAVGTKAEIRFVRNAGYILEAKA